MPPSPMPPARPAAGATLSVRLRARIATGGPITFAEFMEASLYDPEHGFYASVPVGRKGDFVTSPHVSPAFGELVARQVEDFWDILGRPDPFPVLEAGAGDGTLATQILRALSDPIRRAVRYTAVERSPAAREALAERGLTVVASPEEIPPEPVGCVLANELLDNVPFHRVRVTLGGPRELYVDADGDRFVLIEGPISSPEVSELTPDLPLGRETVVAPAALGWLDRVAACIGRGYVWLVDYGFEEDVERRSVHGYRGGRQHLNVMEDPGTGDITAGVDFAALVRHARALGLHVWGPVTQRHALLSLGLRQWDRRARGLQVEAMDAGRGIESVRIYADRSAASLLVDRGGLGDFRVLCVGVGVDQEPAPRSMRTPMKDGD